ncbi:aak-1 [Symbiodinium pilosum]|uniref:Aak-1 protein n=1 Tax=Symbiodinium pilosum TaxID=2952 RepID=A0A812PQ03_SYMPI|nr:aak-1 [Symbiodinium pilosum]
MAVKRSIVATVFGAAVANLLPVFFLQASVSSVSAKWAWMTSPPKCASASPSTWDFDGEATIAAGATGTVTCKDGGTASVATVTCPSSNSAATMSSQDPDWWGTCGFGSSCLSDKSIGTGVTCTGGATTTTTTTSTAADDGSSTTTTTGADSSTTTTTTTTTTSDGTLTNSGSGRLAAVCATSLLLGVAAFQ